MEVDLRVRRRRPRAAAPAPRRTRARRAAIASRRAPRGVGQAGHRARRVLPCLPAPAPPARSLVAAAALLGLPIVLAFFPGGYADRARLAGGIAPGCWSPWRRSRRRRRFPRGAPARAAVAGLALLLAAHRRIAGVGAAACRAYADAQRVALYLGALVAGSRCCAAGPVARRARPRGRRLRSCCTGCRSACRRGGSTLERSAPPVGGSPSRSATGTRWGRSRRSGRAVRRAGRRPAPAVGARALAAAAAPRAGRRPGAHVLARRAARGRGGAIACCSRDRRPRSCARRDRGGGRRRGGDRRRAAACRDATSRAPAQRGRGARRGVVAAAVVAAVRSAG